MVQDALPASDDLAGGADGAARSPIPTRWPAPSRGSVPRPDASADHAALPGALGRRGASTRRGPSPVERERVRRDRRRCSGCRRCAFDNVCSCIRRAVWAQHPFPRCRSAKTSSGRGDVLLAGHRLAFVPEAVVVHSHDRSARYELARTRLLHARSTSCSGCRRSRRSRHLVRAIARLSLLAPAQLRGARSAVAGAGDWRWLAVAWPLGQYLGARDGIRSGWTPSRSRRRLMRILSSPTGFRRWRRAAAEIHAYWHATTLARIARRRRPGADARGRSRARPSTRAPRGCATASRLPGSTTPSRRLRSFEETYDNPAIAAIAAEPHRRVQAGCRAHPSPDRASRRRSSRALRARGVPRLHAARLLAAVPPRPVARSPSAALCGARARRLRALSRPCRVGTGRCPSRRRRVSRRRAAAARCRREDVARRRRARGVAGCRRWRRRRRSARAFPAHARCLRRRRWFRRAVGIDPRSVHRLRRPGREDPPHSLRHSAPAA